MDLEGFVVLADDQTVTDAVQIGPEGGQIHVGIVLADDEHGVEGEGDVLVSDGGKVRLVVLRLLLHLRHGLAPQTAEHPLQNDEVALAAGVHHPGFFQHRIHLRGLGQRLIARGNGLRQHIFGAVLLLRRLLSSGRRQTGYRQHRTLGGLHHGAVGRGHALGHGRRQLYAVHLLQPLGGLGEPPEQQGQDNAGVSAGAPQQGAGGDLGGLAHRGGLALFQLRRSGLDGKAHIGAGIAVRHGEYVQVVDGLLFTGDTGGAEGDHLLEGAAADFFCHALASPPTDVHHTVMESTKTFTSRTSTPVFLVTTYLTSPIMERHTVAIFTPFSTMMCSSMDTVPSSL